jgi:hypothetical protein
MAARKKGNQSAKKLEKGLRRNKRRPGLGRARKDPVRPQPRRNTRRKVAVEREFSPLAGLMGALQKEKIRFQVVGMSAAIMQGVPGTTNDVDLWIDLSPMQERMKKLRNGCPTWI